MNSASDRLSLEGAPPWRIAKPPRAKPELGPELDAWLESRLLFRNRWTLYQVLANIDERILRNEALAELDEDEVAAAILDLVDPSTNENEPNSGQRLTIPKARAFLGYFSRGFRRYCRQHGLREPRLPLVREFALDQGMLKADLFGSLERHRRFAQQLCTTISNAFAKEARAAALTPWEIAALVGASSALFGALPHATQWVEVGMRLSYPLKSDGISIWFDLDEPRPCRWIADPVTEGLLRRFQRLGRLPLNASLLDQRHLQSAIATQFAPGAATHATLRNVRDAVLAAHARHFSPDTAAIAQGIIANTMLPHEPWLRWLTGTRHAAPRQPIALRAPRIHKRVQITTLHEQALFDAVIEKVRTVTTFNPQAQRRSSDIVGSGDPARHHRRKVASGLQEVEQALVDLHVRAGLRGRERRSFAYGLICYARDLVELGGAKRAELAPATISAYVAIACNHLDGLLFADLTAVPTDTRAAHYTRAIVGNGSHQERTNFRTALEGFERSILRHMDLEDEVDWALIPGRAISRHLPRADANLIDPALFRQVWRSLEAGVENKPIVTMARVLLLLLYRFGLRTGEAAEVTTSCLQFHDHSCVSVRVTRSTLTTRKSGSAVRTIGPISLEPDEHEFLRVYTERRIAETIGHQASQGRIYLFSVSGSTRIEHAEAAQTSLIQLVRDISGDPNLRARHFRHSFASGLFVQGRNGIEPDTARDATNEWVRAFFMGHASPETSIVAYMHLHELAHLHDTHELIAATVPPGFLSMLAGNEERSLERALHRHDPAGPCAVIPLYLKALRRNLACPELRYLVRERVPYMAAIPDAEAVQPEPSPPLDWRTAWEGYAAARVGKRVGDEDEQTTALQAQVRDLELRGLISPRRTRRPQLDAELEGVAAKLWHQAPHDLEFRQAIAQALAGVRDARSRVRLPAAVARTLETRLSVAGLKGIHSSASSGRQLWLFATDAQGRHVTGWLELIPFAYCGFRDDSQGS
ncbi:MAG TPA: hypothetical protein PLN31_20160 [Azoarcus taiwanensis]|nr:hypothetical protein [Azoarcus taiwanensis]